MSVAGLSLHGGLPAMASSQVKSSGLQPRSTSSSPKLWHRHERQPWGSRTGQGPTLSLCAWSSSKEHTALDLRILCVVSPGRRRLKKLHPHLGDHRQTKSMSERHRDEVCRPLLPISRTVEQRPTQGPLALGPFSVSIRSGDASTYRDTLTVWSSVVTCRIRRPCGGHMMAILSSITG